MNKLATKRSWQTSSAWMRGVRGAGSDDEKKQQEKTLTRCTGRQQPCHLQAFRPGFFQRSTVSVLQKRKPTWLPLHVFVSVVCLCPDKQKWYRCSYDTLYSSGEHRHRRQRHKKQTKGSTEKIQWEKLKRNYSSRTCCTKNVMNQNVSSFYWITFLAAVPSTHCTSKLLYRPTVASLCTVVPSFMWSGTGAGLMYLNVSPSGLLCVWCCCYLSNSWHDRCVMRPWHDD